jgi:hypothetical protein
LTLSAGVRAIGRPAFGFVDLRRCSKVRGPSPQGRGSNADEAIQHHVRNSIHAPATTMYAALIRWAPGTWWGADAHAPRAAGNRDLATPRGSPPQGTIAHGQTTGGTTPITGRRSTRNVAAPGGSSTTTFGCSVKSVGTAEGLERGDG